MTSLPAQYLEYLDRFEESDYFKVMDLAWLEVFASSAMERYEVSGPGFALMLLDTCSYLQSLVARVAEKDELYHAETDRGCEIGIGITEFVVKMTALAAVATREERGKEPICLIPEV